VKAEVMKMPFNKLSRLDYLVSGILVLNIFW